MKNRSRLTLSEISRSARGSCSQVVLPNQNPKQICTTWIMLKVGDVTSSHPRPDRKWPRGNAAGTFHWRNYSNYKVVTINTIITFQFLSEPDPSIYARGGHISLHCHVWFKLSPIAICGGCAGLAQGHSGVSPLGARMVHEGRQLRLPAPIRPAENAAMQTRTGLPGDRVRSCSHRANFLSQCCSLGIETVKRFCEHIYIHIYI